MGEKIYTDQLAILSAKFLQNYCREHECSDCVLSDMGNGCTIDPPYHWELEEIENRRSEHA